MSQLQNGSLSPVITAAADVAGGQRTEIISSGGGINVAASVDVNDGITADIDAAVAAIAGLRLIGFACRESAATAAAATFRIVHGATGAAGTVLVPIELAANESTREWFGPEGIACASGLSIDHIAGTMDVELFYKVLL